MIVKICGVTRVDDAAAIAAAGADYIGLNFWPSSKRFVAIDHAIELASAIRAAGPTKIVGVFVDAAPADVSAIAARVGLDIVQLHGTIDAATIARPVWQALPARAGMAIDAGRAEAVLLDTPSVERGGSGITFDWAIAAEARRAHPALRILLAGGLTPDNVAQAIAVAEPWGVDVASGVERSPGVKDVSRVTAFLAAARAR
jgi:phosphoribosylanthranilate isomerase